MKIGGLNINYVIINKVVQIILPCTLTITFYINCLSNEEWYWIMGLLVANGERTKAEYDFIYEYLK